MSSPTSASTNGGASSLNQEDFDTETIEGSLVHPSTEKESSSVHDSCTSESYVHTQNVPLQGTSSDSDSFVQSIETRTNESLGRSDRDMSTSTSPIPISTSKESERTAQCRLNQCQYLAQCL